MQLLWEVCSFFEALKTEDENFKDFDPEEDKAREEKVMEVTLTDVQKFVKERNVHPSDLYKWQDITKDREFEDETSKISTLSSDLERVSKEYEALKTESETAILESKSNALKSKLSEVIKDFEGPQKRYLEKRFDIKDLSSQDETGINDFVKNANKEFNDIFGATSEPSDVPAGKAISTNDAKSEAEQALAELLQ